MSDDFDTRQVLGPLVNKIYIYQLCGLDNEFGRYSALMRPSVEQLSMGAVTTLSSA